MGFDGLMTGFLVTLNVIFFSIGTATLAVGIWVKVDDDYLFALTKEVSGTDFNDTDIPSLLESAVLVLIVAGACIFLLGFFGCCGALLHKSKGGKLLLKVYCMIVLILVVVECAGVVVTYLFYEKVEGKLNDLLSDSLNKNYDATFTHKGEGKYTYSSNGDPITLAWDIVQLQYECCGVSGGADYKPTNMTWSSAALNVTVPPTCCNISDGSQNMITDLKNERNSSFTLDDQLCPSQDHESFNSGCYEEVKKAVEENIDIFIGVGAGTVGIEVLCIIFACCLARKSPDEVSALKIPET